MKKCKQPVNKSSAMGEPNYLCEVINIEQFTFKTMGWIPSWNSLSFHTTQTTDQCKHCKMTCSCDLWTLRPSYMLRRLSLCWKDIQCHVRPYTFLRLQITRSDIMPYWAVSLMIANGHLSSSRLCVGMFGWHTQFITPRICRYSHMNCKTISTLG